MKPKTVTNQMAITWGRELKKSKPSKPLGSRIADLCIWVTY